MYIRPYYWKSNGDYVTCHCYDRLGTELSLEFKDDRETIFYSFRTYEWCKVTESNLLSSVIGVPINNLPPYINDTNESRPICLISSWKDKLFISIVSHGETNNYLLTNSVAINEEEQNIFDLCATVKIEDDLLTNVSAILKNNLVKYCVYYQLNDDIVSVLKEYCLAIDFLQYYSNNLYNYSLVSLVNNVMIIKKNTFIISQYIDICNYMQVDNLDNIYSIVEEYLEKKLEYKEDSINKDFQENNTVLSNLKEYDYKGFVISKMLSLYMEDKLDVSEETMDLFNKIPLDIIMKTVQKDFVDDFVGDTEIVCINSKSFLSKMYDVEDDVVFMAEYKHRIVFLDEDNQRRVALVGKIIFLDRQSDSDELYSYTVNCIRNWTENKPFPHTIYQERKDCISKVLR